MDGTEMKLKRKERVGSEDIQMVRIHSGKPLGMLSGFLYLSASMCKHSIFVMAFHAKLVYC